VNVKTEGKYQIGQQYLLVNKEALLTYKCTENYRKLLINQPSGDFQFTNHILSKVRIESKRQLIGLRFKLGHKLTGLLLILLLFAGFESPAQKEATFKLEVTQSDYQDLEEYLQVYVDSSRHLTIDQIRSKPYSDQFAPVTKLKPSYNRKFIYWGKLAIRNPTDRAINRHLYLGNALKIDAYIYSNDSFVSQKQTGFLLPMVFKDLKANGYGSITFNFPANSLVEIWIRIEAHPNGDWRYHFSPKISSVEKFVELTYFDLTRDSIFLGAFFLLFFYHFMIYLIYRDPVYLHYAMYIFLSSFFLPFYDLSHL